MSGRDAILGRIREALRIATDPHVRRSTGGDGDVDASSRAVGDEAGEGGGAGEGGEAGEAPAFRAWLPVAGETFEQQVALFAEHCVALKTAFHRVADESAAIELLRRVAADEGWSRIASHDRPTRAAVCEALGLPVTWTDDGYDPADLERCDAAVTGCDALIAQTGSVLITARSAGGRALSVLPPHHVVLASADQMAADLAEGYQRLRQRHGQAYPSLISFITGPSRTGDIERILVLGAHGPRKLTVVLIEGRAGQLAPAEPAKAGEV